MLTEKTFDTGSVMIHYIEGPPSGRPLVLVHGLHSRWQTFLPILPTLSVRYHTYALEMRGFGRSGRTPGAYHMADFAGDIVQFLRKRVAEPAALLGHSMGASVTPLVAATAPECLQALILEEPAPNVLSEETWQTSSALRGLRDLLATRPSVAELMAAEGQRRPHMNAAELRAHVTSLLQMDPDVLTHIVDSRTDQEVLGGEVLPKITCPVLLILGNPALGGIIEDRHVERSREFLAQCIHVRLPDAGHGVHTTRPLEFCQIVMNFLESI